MGEYGLAAVAVLLCFALVRGFIAMLNHMIDGPPSPRNGRMPLQLPTGPVEHFTSEKPLSKRAKRRLRGKAKT